MKLTQDQINHGTFGLMTGAVAIVLASAPFANIGFVSIIFTIVTLLICATLWFAYWRGWTYARPLFIVLLTFIIAFGTPDQDVRSYFQHAIYVAPIIALVLTGPIWVLGSSLTLLGVFFYRAGGGSYTHPTELVIFGIIIGGMIFSRLAVDNNQRLEAAIREAETQRANVEDERRRAETQAAELAQRNAEQQGLLDLVAVLETPTITVGEGMLLVPIVGSLDSRRAQALTSRLLQDVSARRARHVILDIAGVTAVDTQVAHSLLQTTQGLQLLGCKVTLTGISPTVATTLSQLGLALTEVAIARSPEDVLNRQEIAGSNRALVSSGH